jgi:hypothetical protein
MSRKRPYWMWTQGEREGARRRHRYYRKNLRIRAIRKLGAQCACNDTHCHHKGRCNIDDIRVLEIDHINGDGDIQTKHGGPRTGADEQRLFTSVLNGHRNDVQVLCANCHRLKTRREQDHLSSTSSQKTTQHTNGSGQGDLFS